MPCPIFAPWVSSYSLSSCSLLSVRFVAALLRAGALTFSPPASVSLSLQVDRLMELHFKYLEAVQQADKRIEGEKHVSAPFLSFPSLFIHHHCPLDVDCWMNVLTLLCWKKLIVCGFVSTWLWTQKLSSVSDLKSTREKPHISDHTCKIIKAGLF